jgi:hypothetical protein
MPGKSASASTLPANNSGSGGAGAGGGSAGATGAGMAASASTPALVGSSQSLTAAAGAGGNAAAGGQQGGAGSGGGLKLSKTAATIAKAMGLSIAYNNTNTSNNNTGPSLLDGTSRTANSGASFASLNHSSTPHELTLAQQKELLQKFEAEVMGEQEENKGTKSEIRARNYEQMVGVLKHKLKALETAAQKRMYLCEKDLDNFSTECSKATKITDDFEDLNLNFSRLPAPAATIASYFNTGGATAGAATLGGTGPGAMPDMTNTTTMTNTRAAATTGAGGNHRDNNLVTSDTVFVDATHLVVRTKQATETGKKLEAQLEECFGSVNMRELKGKKSKGGMLNRQEKPKKSVRQKNEAKKQARNRLEKLLHANMENYVTRSVNDQDMKFHAPSQYDDMPVWPVSVKFTLDDPKEQAALGEMYNNSEGDMNLRVLLLYAIERITLQSGEAVFRRLAKEKIMQEYLLCLFWLVKLKFFQPDSTEHDEGYLLQMMSKDYVKIVEFMALMAHAEYEKDYIFKYLPFIFCNAIYYAFHSLFPGSRHIYTRAFRKTILIQVVQIMHGVQLSQLSVKVSWAKLFPDDNLQDEGGMGGGNDGEENEGGESFPVQLAFSKRPRSASQYEKMHLSHSVHDHRQLHVTHATPHLPMNATTVNVAYAASSPNPMSRHGPMMASLAAAENEFMADPNSAPGSASSAISALGATTPRTPRGTQLPPLMPAMERTGSATSAASGSSAAGRLSLNSAGIPMSRQSPVFSPVITEVINNTINNAIIGIAANRARYDDGIKRKRINDPTMILTKPAEQEGFDDFLIGKLPTIAPTERTMLKPPLEKPSGKIRLTMLWG